MYFSGNMEVSPTGVANQPSFRTPKAVGSQTDLLRRAVVRHGGMESDK